MSDKHSSSYGRPQADQLVQCPSCKEHIEVCDAVLVSGKQYCDGCAETVREDIKRIRERYPKCPACKGVGHVWRFDLRDSAECRDCSGEGVIEVKLA